MITSVYIHIPFCNQICSYCDFPKVCYYKKWIDNYLDSLEEEIKNNYQQDIIKTIYIGGGTPSSLTIKELNKLFDILKIFKLDDNYEYTIECNIKDINEEFLTTLKNNDINRISIGVQSFNNSILKYLNRETNVDYMEKINMVKKYFDNINIDLMYAIPGETFDNLVDDLDKFLSLNINHISCYSLILEKNTKLYLNNTKPISQKLDLKMYQYIEKNLKDKGYEHYEVSNYAKKGYFSNHNLNYWNNDRYYGFGLGASGYIKDIRYTNTVNLNKYLNRDYNRQKEQLSLKDMMIYEMILGLRKKEGVSKRQFQKKYQKQIKEVFEIEKLIKEKKLIEEEDNIYINPKYIYVSNDILINFVE